MFFVDFIMNYASSLLNMFNGWVYSPPGTSDAYKQIMSNPNNR